MYVLVTGGAGFIGSHVVDVLLGRGNKVVVVDDLNDYYLPAQKEANVARHEPHPNYTFYKLDIRDAEALEKVFKEHPITHIVHVAARAGVRPSLQNPHIYITTNMLGTLNVLELARKYKVKNVVKASSSSVYGKSELIPFSEDHKVDTQISPYAASKKGAENLAHAYSHLYGIPITVVRFFTVYGPRGRRDMAPFIFMDSIHKGKPIDVYGDGTTARDYTFVKDIVSGVVAALDKPQPFAVYNLGNNRPQELNTFIETMERVVGKEAVRVQKPMQAGDVHTTWADISKAQQDLGYAPKTNLEQGLREMYQWYKEEVDEN